ncbi:MAG: TspO/MBR family protein [Flavobacteriaceae bacterium]
MKKKLTYIIITVSICLLIGFLSGFVATQTSANDWYIGLNKPSFNPPNWIFAPVWTILYIMTGIAVGIIWAKGFYHLLVKTALYHFGFQLLLNASWGIVFYGFKAPFWSLLIILILVVLIILTIQWFKLISKTAAYLLIPYLVWVCFVTILNYNIWILN